MKMTTRDKGNNQYGTPSSTISSPIHKTFSSESEDGEEEWSSCAGELEKGRVTDILHITKSINNYTTSKDTKSVKTCSELVQKLDIYTRNYPESTSTEKQIKSVHQCASISFADATEGDIDSLKKDWTTLDGNDKNVKEDEEITQTRIIRNPSYQKAVSPCQPSPVSIPGIICNESTFQGAIYKDNRAPVGVVKNRSAQKVKLSTNRNPSPIPESPTLLVPNLPTPNDSTSGENIPRSVSFNDNLLDSKRKDSPEPAQSSQSSSRKGSDSPSLPGTPTVRRFLSTPGRIQHTPSISPSGSSPDMQLTFSTSPTDLQGKRSIKSLTNTLARRLSFRTTKMEKLQKNAKSLELQNINGLPSTEDGVVSYEGLIRLFECPGCQNYMTPPLLQCRKGHIVCEKCKVTYKATCPNCKQRVTDATNYMMEQVCQLVRFPCRFGKHGCPEYYPPRQKTDHENFCHFRPVHCHFASFGCSHVLPLKDMKIHMNQCKFNPHEEIIHV